jgi:hypothetical protein
MCCELSICTVFSFGSPSFASRSCLHVTADRKLFPVTISALLSAVILYFDSYTFNYHIVLETDCQTFSGSVWNYSKDD